MDDYQGSIAQENVSFSTSVALETIPGDNYYKLMIFLGIAQAGESLITVPTVETLYEFTPSSFAAATKGLLKDWLTAFFANAGNTKVYVVAFVDEVGSVWSEAGLISAMAKYESLAYWKAMLYYLDSTGIDLTKQYYTAYEALAELQKLNPSLTGPILVNEYDVLALTTPASTISGQLKAAGLDAFSVYHASALTKAPALVQLGITLGFLNVSGTPVGNSMDYVATNTINASGAAGANLTAAQQTILKNSNIGYYKTVGNGTGFVALIGGMSLLGDVLAAEWIVQYNDYYCEMKVAELITKMNTYKSRSTYAVILAIMSVQIERFADTSGLGRLTNLKITAPVFAKLPAAAGDTIVIPNAWTATYVDNVREVQVQGTLTIAV